MLEIIAEGKSLRSACAEHGIHVSSMNDYLESSEELSGQYARARERRADTLAERGLTLGMAAATGQTYEGRKIEPNGARVALDAIKWAAGKMAPKKYGERVGIDHGGSVDLGLHAWLVAAQSKGAGEKE